MEADLVVAEPCLERTPDRQGCDALPRFRGEGAVGCGSGGCRQDLERLADILDPQGRDFIRWGLREDRDPVQVELHGGRCLPRGEIDVDALDLAPVGRKCSPAESAGDSEFVPAGGQGLLHDGDGAVVKRDMHHDGLVPLCAVRHVQRDSGGGAAAQAGVEQRGVFIVDKPEARAALAARRFEAAAQGGAFDRRDGLRFGHETFGRTPETPFPAGKVRGLRIEKADLLPPQHGKHAGRPAVREAGQANQGRQCGEERLM